MDTVSEERSYIAFISYRHKPLDKQAAEMIQKKIEHFKVPEEYRDVTGGKSLGKVFRDEDELPASSSLSGSITYALDHSKFLIVICTPDLPLSHWCEEEIRYFLSTHDRDHVLAVLADGTPDVSFSPYLLHIYDEDGNIIKDTEPLAANIAGPNHTIDRKAFNKEIVRIYAALLGCPFDALWQRERRDRTNRIVRVMGVILAAMSIFIAVVLSQNKQIQSQNRSLQKQLSSSYVESGQKKLEEYRTNEALSDAIHALLDGSDEELIDPRTEKLMGDALGIYTDKDPRSTLLYEQTPAITSLKTTADGTRVYIADEYGYIRGIDGKTGKVLWEKGTLINVDQSLDIPTQLYYLDTQDILLCKNPANVYALNSNTGEELWKYTYTTENHYLTISPDQKICVLTDKGYAYDPPTDLYFLYTDTGKEMRHIVLENEESMIQMSSIYQANNSYNGAFSANQKYYACIFYEVKIEDKGTGEYEFYIFDTETGEIVNQAHSSDPESSPELVYGIKVSDDGQHMFCARYNNRYGVLLISLLDFEHNQFSNESANHIIQAAHGEEIAGMNYSKVRVEPMLTSDHLALIFSQNSWFIYLLEDGRLIKNVEMSGDIVEARWVDQEEEVVFILTSTGAAFRYDLGHEGIVFEEVEGTYLDQDNQHLSVSANDGFLLNEENGFFYSVPEDHQSQILTVKLITDPSRLVLPDQPETRNRILFLFETPSRDKILAFYPADTGLDLRIYDAQTQETLDRVHYDTLEKTSPITILDDTHFIQKCKVYCTDGTEEYLDGLSEDDDNFFFYAYHVRDNEGNVLTCAETWEDNGHVLRFWANNEQIENDYDQTTKISSDFRGGKNGYFLLMDSASDQEENNTKDLCTLLDVAGKTHKQVHLLTEKENIDFFVLGGKEPVFAAVESTGRVVLYDIEADTSMVLSEEYSAGEVSTLCFAAEDQYVVILTGAGRMDIYNRESGELLFRDNFSSLKFVRTSYIDSMSCRMDPEHHRMYILIGRTYYSPYEQMITIDTDTFTVLSESYDIYDWFSSNNKIYAARDNVKINFPAYHREELTQWAKEVTGE